MALTKIDDRGLKTPIDLQDSEKIRLGTGNDLEVFHDGSHSYIKDTGTGRLILQSSQLCLQSTTGENLLVGNPDGATELYHDNSKKLETTSSGVTVTGGITASGSSEFTEDVKFDGSTTGRDILFDRSEDKLHFADSAKAVFGESSDLEIYHDTENYIKSATASVNLILESAHDVYIKHGAENMLKCTGDAGVELFFDGTAKLETRSGDTLFHDDIRIQDNNKINIGTLDDLQLYHDGTDSIIDNNTGELKIQADNMQFLTSDASEKFIDCNGNGNVELYYNNSKKFETDANGIHVTTNVHLPDNGVLELGDGSDGQLSHTGSDFNIINHTGTFVLGCNSGTGVGEGQIVFKSGNNNTRWSISSGGDFKPASNNAFAIGSSSYRVSVIYANTSLDTSDRNAKNTIIESDLGLDFINKLKPVSYKWNQYEGEISDTKTHYGLIAQDIEETVVTEGKEITDFGFIDKPKEGQMSLAYNELISPLIKAIQELSAEVNKLKAA